MASGAKTMRFDLDSAIAFIQASDGEDFDDSEDEGLSSGEESEIDHILLNEADFSDDGPSSSSEQEDGDGRDNNDREVINQGGDNDILEAAGDGDACVPLVQDPDHAQDAHAHAVGHEHGHMSGDDPDYITSSNDSETSSDGDNEVNAGRGRACGRGAGGRGRGARGRGQGACGRRQGGQGRKTKTNRVWREANVVQPVVIQRYNAYMNGVDRSDQILANNHCLRKCRKWWKVLFLHLIDIAVVNAFILFKKQQQDNPENEALRRPSNYSVLDFREELIRQLCGLETFAPPPADSRVKPPDQFDLGDHVPLFSPNVRRSCKVCSKEGIDSRVFSFCSAPQCQEVYLHCTKEKNCFVRWHSRDYQR